MDANSLENICRICLTAQDTLFSLFRVRRGTSPYEKLVRRTRLNIRPGDAGPPSICSQCLADLDTTAAFLDRCERADRLLAARLAADRPGDRVLAARLSADRPEADEKAEERTPPPAPEQHPAPAEAPAERCGQCGARRRCRHWAPPAARDCPYCHKTFKKKYNYQVHLKLHVAGGDGGHACGACGARCASRWRAARHCAAAAGRARLACSAPGCARSYTSAHNLRTHLRKHSGEKPFECDDCGKSFISKNILTNHMRIHTGVKPYMCQVCGAQFATNKLAAHLAAHAAGAAARPHVCARALCARAFRTARDLREHARSHAAERAHGCALCAARYKYKQSLNHHVRAVHGLQAKKTEGISALMPH